MPMAGAPIVQRCTRFFQYRLKAAEFRYRTWRNKREIQRAYASRAPVAIAVRRWLPYAAGAGIAAVLLVAAALLVVRTLPRRQNMAGTPAQHIQQPQVEPSAQEEARLPDVVQETRLTSPAEQAGAQEAENVSESAAQARKGSQAWSIPERMEYLILANKAEKKIYLLGSRGGQWLEVTQNEIALGENGGRKERSGDRKTPEGQYFIVGKKERSELSQEYGPMAYVLNYPNGDDRRAGRTGQGIWIHGTSPDSMPLQTRGCLEMHNADLEALSAYLGIGIGTPVLIVNKRRISEAARVPNYERIERERTDVLAEYELRRERFVALVDEWKGAWESMQMERYAACYDTSDFLGQGMTWGAWRERKQRTFDVYRQIQIRVDKIILSDLSPSAAVVKFIQEYSSDALQVVNGKKLCLVKAQDRWKIRREETFPKEELLL